ncbi:MAG: serine hydrolase [Lachnospiraceae bacterium]|nr:serine hydrolase [Lachnospiraceae bacterium]
MHIVIRKRTYVKVLAGFLAVFVLCSSFSFRASAYEDWPTECYVLSEGACLIDADSGIVLFDRNAHEKYYPASITKVLTALIVIENCENLSETVVFSYDAVHIAEQNSTIIGASEDDRLSVLDCLYCLLFQSANEVANALAEHVGAKHPDLKEKGMTDLQVFVKLMNRKAEELGCLGSHFNNPSGLTDSDHYTTPYDMCLIMQAAIKNDTFRDIESHTYWKHAPIRRYPDADDPWNTVYMKHLMLRKNSTQYYKGCIAGKTGYTVTAGNTLVTACRRDGMTLCCCVMNAHANHYNDTTRLFDFGFDNFKSVKVSDYENTNELIQNDYKLNGIPVIDSVTLGISDDTRITIPKAGDYSEVVSEFSDGEMRWYYGKIFTGSAKLSVMPLGGMKEVNEASEDPMYYRIAGIEPPTEETTETETVEESMEDTVEEVTGTETAASETPEESKENNDTVKPVKEKKGNPVGRIVTIVCSILLLLAVLLLLRIMAEKAEQKRRRERRLERMRKTEDLTGSQRIDMDLEVQRKLKKTHRKK